MLTAAQGFAAHSSGIFINVNVSAGEREGDGLLWTTNDDSFTPFDTTFYELFYDPGYSFTAGYEYSFSKHFSARAALGYQYVVMKAHSERLVDNKWVPTIDDVIDRHWLTIPIEGKAMLPFRKSGVYVAAGPKISMLMASKHKDGVRKVEVDLADSSSFINFQLGFRLGWETAIANVGYLYIETGYHTGLVELDPLLFHYASIGIGSNYSRWRHTKKYREGEAALGVGFRINFPTGQ